MIDATEYTRHMLDRSGRQHSDFDDDFEDCDVTEEEDTDAVAEAFSRGYFDTCDSPEHFCETESLHHDRHKLPYDEQWLARVLGPEA